MCDTVFLNQLLPLPPVFKILHANVPLDPRAHQFIVAPANAIPLDSPFKPPLLDLNNNFARLPTFDSTLFLPEASPCTFDPNSLLSSKNPFQFLRFESIPEKKIHKPQRSSIDKRHLHLRKKLTRAIKKALLATTTLSEKDEVFSTDQYPRDKEPTLNNLMDYFHNSYRSNFVRPGAMNGPNPPPYRVNSPGRPTGFYPNISMRYSMNRPPPPGRRFPFNPRTSSPNPRYGNSVTYNPQPTRPPAQFTPAFSAPVDPVFEAVKAEAAKRDPSLYGFLANKATVMPNKRLEKKAKYAKATIKCEACNAKFLTEYLHEAHTKTERHIQRAESFEAAKQAVEEGKIVKIDNCKVSQFYCEACSVHLNSVVQYDLHIKGVKHKKKEKAKKLADAVKSEYADAPAKTEVMTSSTADTTDSINTNNGNIKVADVVNAQKKTGKNTKRKSGNWQEYKNNKKAKKAAAIIAMAVPTNILLNASTISDSDIVGDQSMLSIVEPNSEAELDSKEQKTENEETAADDPLKSIDSKKMMQINSIFNAQLYQNVQQQPCFYNRAGRFFQCAVCGIRVNSSVQMDQHIISKKHKSKMALVARQMRPMMNARNAKPPIPLFPREIIYT